MWVDQIFDRPDDHIFETVNPYNLWNFPIVMYPTGTDSAVTAEAVMTAEDGDRQILALGGELV
jgi:hypothetical protein